VTRSSKPESGLFYKTVHAISKQTILIALSLKELKIKTIVSVESKFCLGEVEGMSNKIISTYHKKN
jgi:hypothetical protein